MIKVILKKLFKNGVKIGDSYTVEKIDNKYIVNGEELENNSNLKTLLKSFKSKKISFTILNENEIRITDYTNQKNYII